MAYCRVIDGRVVEVWRVEELPPLTEEMAALYIPCADTVEEGYIETSPGVFEPWTDPDYLEKLRAKVIAEITAHGLSLIAAQVPALNSLDMVGLMATLWPHLTTPDTSPELFYCREVYNFALGRIETAKTADQTTLEAYDAIDDNWPDLPA
jgi:hypothetical protein